MANHQDAEITEVVVVLHKECSADMAGALQLLKTAGLDVLNTDAENDVVEGAIESFKLPALQKLACVDYVRTVLTYIADYPPGDPRDKDGDEDDDD